jgi:hypothetical protein
MGWPPSKVVDFMGFKLAAGERPLVTGSLWQQNTVSVEGRQVSIRFGGRLDTWIDVEPR